MTEIDDLDRKILEKLEKDGRKSYRKIAKELDCSEGTVYNRVEKMKENGTIKGFTVWTDPSRVGEKLVALIGMKVEGGHLIEVEEEVAERDEIRCVYDVTGNYDSVVLGRFEDRSKLNKFVKETLGNKWVERTMTQVVLNVVKEDFRTLV